MCLFICLFGPDLDITSGEVKQATISDDHMIKGSSSLPTLPKGYQNYQEPFSQYSSNPKNNTCGNCQLIPDKGDKSEEKSFVSSGPKVLTEVSNDLAEVEMDVPSDVLSGELSNTEEEHRLKLGEQFLLKGRLILPPLEENKSSALPCLEINPHDDEMGSSFQENPNTFSLSDTMSESTSIFSMTTIAEVSEEDDLSISDSLKSVPYSEALPKENGQNPAVSASDIFTLDGIEHPCVKDDTKDTNVDDVSAEFIKLYEHEQHPAPEVDILSAKSSDLVSISDGTSLFDSTVRVTTTEDAYTDEGKETSNQESFVSSTEEPTQPHCLDQNVESTTFDLPLEFEKTPVLLSEFEGGFVMPKEFYTEPVASNALTTPMNKREVETKDSIPIDIPMISITDDTADEGNNLDSQSLSSTPVEEKPSDKLQNAKSLLSSLVSIDVNVNEGRADKIIRRLSKTPEMISVTRTLRESSLQPDQEDVWSSRRSSFYCEFDETAPVFEHIPSPEMMRSRRPSLRRDSETVIKETVVSTPAVEIRAEETTYDEPESDADIDQEDGDDTIMQINISFEGLRQRISSERSTRSEERRRSVASMLDFSSHPEDVFQRTQSVPESYSRRSSTTPASDRLGSFEEKMSPSIGSEDFQIPEINVETEVEDTTDENIQETVLEVADKVFVTVRSEKLTNTVSDISIKIAAKYLAPDLFQKGGFLGLPAFKPACAARGGPQEDKEEPEGSTSSTSTTVSDMSETNVFTTQQDLTEVDDSKKESDSLVTELAENTQAEICCEQEQITDMPCEEREERKQFPVKDDTETLNSLKDGEMEVTMNASDFPQQDTSLHLDSAVDMDRNDLSQVPSLDQSPRICQRKENLVSLTLQAEQLSPLGKSKKLELDTVYMPFLYEEEEGFFDRGLKEGISSLLLIIVKHFSQLCKIVSRLFCSKKTA